MTPNERELILGVANELRAADRSAIDPEADRLIRAEIASQPNAAYLLTQRVIVQQLALRRAEERIRELEARAGSAGGAGSGRSFLGGAAEPQPPSTAAAQPVGQQQAPAGGGVGSFLKTAAAAAAGTIGGQLIYDGVRHLAAGHWGDTGGGGIFGAPLTGGFLPSGLGGSSPDYQADRSAPARDQDWGSGGDFGADSSDTANQDDDEIDDDETSDQGEWDDDGTDDSGSPDDGGGGDW